MSKSILSKNILTSQNQFSNQFDSSKSGIKHASSIQIIVVEECAFSTKQRKILTLDLSNSKWKQPKKRVKVTSHIRKQKIERKCNAKKELKQKAKIVSY
jgi:hypothetical protein